MTYRRQQTGGASFAACSTCNVSRNGKTTFRWSFRFAISGGLSVFAIPTPGAVWLKLSNDLRENPSISIFAKAINCAQGGLPPPMLRHE
jgi:hypothetical protein